MIYKILVTGFSHCGTTILRSIISHISNVYEIVDEKEDINDEDIRQCKKMGKTYIVIKTPVMKEKFFGEKYNDYYKIFIIRNPIYVFSSLNRRKPNLHEAHLYCYLNVIKIFYFLLNYPVYEDMKSYSYFNTKNKFIDKTNFDNIYPQNNLFMIKYEDMFSHNYKFLKNILDKIGLQYENEIFDNSKYINTSHSIFFKNKNIANKHERLRNEQINKPFENFNCKSEIFLLENQKKILNEDIHLKYIYPEIDNLK